MALPTICPGSLTAKAWEPLLPVRDGRGTATVLLVLETKACEELVFVPTTTPLLLMALAEPVTS